MNSQLIDSPAPALSDREVTERILGGEQRLYEVIMRRYNAMLYRVSMSMLNNDADAEDVMQTTYIKAYEHLAGFEHKSGMGTWLTRILINECLQHRKKRKHVIIELNNDGVYGARGHGAELLLNKELRAILEQALLKLPEKYRMVFVLREVERMSIAETMDVLNITEANVKVRLNRAKTMLRDALTTQYGREGLFEFHLTRCDRVVNNVFRHLGGGLAHD